MEFKSSIAERIGTLQKEIRQLSQNLEAERDSFVETKVAEGWTKFVYHSSYYGSHSERGEGDEEVIYLFRHDVDSSRWEGVQFGHGSFGASDNNASFATWFGGLAEDQYIEIQ